MLFVRNQLDLLLINNFLLEYSMIKWRHCSVKCHFVNVDRGTEGELILALRAQNE